VLEENDKVPENLLGPETARKPVHFLKFIGKSVRKPE
jgi:hypothetical protein